ncbi:hypothetical protein M413DRAFT_120912 [Hebeloma cylindrosporum]|uniref:Uncharacterized protein n=1 Tax=Hebeloma cylindrosporum TaxID=76867 RepID=A0A0C2YNQ6_HEBCY|nr:hypothetical protein M413DRAFT_120912 [Hebeloma cylindrosporum h7]
MQWSLAEAQRRGGPRQYNSCITERERCKYARSDTRHDSLDSRGVRRYPHRRPRARTTDDCGEKTLSIDSAINVYQHTLFPYFVSTTWTCQTCKTHENQIDLVE